VNSHAVTDRRQEHRNMDTEQRLIELEARVAHQDQSIVELSEEIYRQQQQIVLLEGLCRELHQRMQSLGAAGPASDPSDEIPPHY